MNNMNEEIRALLATTLLITTGAASHALSQYKLAKDNQEEFSRTDFFVLLFIAGFTGWMFALFVDIITDNQLFIRVGAGTGSFLGLAGMNYLASHILKKLKITEDGNDKEN